MPEHIDVSYVWLADMIADMVVDRLGKSGPSDSSIGFRDDPAPPHRPGASHGSSTPRSIAPQKVCRRDAVEQDSDFSDDLSGRRETRRFRSRLNSCSSYKQRPYKGSPNLELNTLHSRVCEKLLEENRRSRRQERSGAATRNASPTSECSQRHPGNGGSEAMSEVGQGQREFIPQDCSAGSCARAQSVSGGGCSFDALPQGRNGGRWVDFEPKASLEDPQLERSAASVRAECLVNNRFEIWRKRPSTSRPRTTDLQSAVRSEACDRDDYLGIVPPHPPPGQPPTMKVDRGSESDSQVRRCQADLSADAAAVAADIGVDGGGGDVQINDEDSNGHDGPNVLPLDQGTNNQAGSLGLRLPHMISGFIPGMSMTPSKSARVHAVESLRKRRHEELTSIMHKDADDPILEADLGGWAVLLQGLVWSFNIAGVLPWEVSCVSPQRRCQEMLSLGHQLGIVVMLLAVVWQSMTKQASEDVEGISPLAAAMHATVALGALVGFLTLGVFPRRRRLMKYYDLLRNYAYNCECLLQWCVCCAWDCAFVVVVWLSTVGLRAYEEGLFDGQVHFDGVAQCAFNGISMWIFLSIAMMVLHICSGLSCIVDAFCYAALTDLDFCWCVREWNSLQAIVREGSGKIEYCLAALKLTLTGVAALRLIELTMVDSFDTWLQLKWAIVASIPLCATVLRVFFAAAKVTEKCGRVPSFINSLGRGIDIDDDRLYAVQYITHSKPGFYVFEVQLSNSLMVKAVYVTSVVIFGVASKLI